MLVLTVAAVLVLELPNTAMEAVVDLATGRRYHSLARIAKDRAAAAVLTAAISSLLIALFLLLPPSLLRLGPDSHSQMLLVIDNYDSFTFNLVQYFGEPATQHPVAADLQVHRKPTASCKWAFTASRQPQHGPGTQPAHPVQQRAVADGGPVDATTGAEQRSHR